MSKTFRELLIGDARRILSEAVPLDGKRISNLSIPHTALLLSQLDEPFIFIEDTYESASRLSQDLISFRTMLDGVGVAVLLPPPLNIELVGKRVEALRSYLSLSDCSMIASKDAIDSAMDIFALEEGAFTLLKDMDIERQVLRDWLLKSGYREVSMVVDKGEFSHRSYIFDIFPASAEEPVRVEFFGDTIDTIKIFDIETQRSKDEVSKLDLFTTSESLSNEDMLNQLMVLKRASIFLSSQVEAPQLPDSIVPTVIYHRPINAEGICSSENTFSGLGILPQERKGIAEVPRFIKGSAKPTISLVQSRAQAERLREMLEEEGLYVPVLSAGDVGSYSGAHCISTGIFSSGINLPDVMVLTDKEIFGERPLIKPSRRQRLSRILLNLEELKPGDFVVHRDYGIGRFRGINRSSVGEIDKDLITIEYDNASLHIPIENIGLISKHSSSDSRAPFVDKLGSKRWLNNKLKARLGAEEIAKKLIQLYAERTVSRGFVFSEDTALHREFDEFFVYQETPDQARAVEDIKNLMHTDKPMDMLLCGDVGYGKTEVVMRAAFRAVFDKKQAAVLVPTTILAEQHYRTFKARFSGFNVKIDYISRFKSGAERAKTLKALARHEVDIIIGTHALLRKDILFADLGLLVIDEEHKFGVQQKERLKELRKGVDVITLTATPIPRTLQMSLSGIREMSIIETPPEDRVSVKTFTAVYNTAIVRDAIERELHRGGQVYYVYNRISQIEDKAAMIRGAVKDARVATAHGDMYERDLEKVMYDFMNHNIDVLVCTAIIGSGLDIPSANTIIIDRADIFGLADLYQLRGRVGRSSVQAYAYLLIPEEERLKEDAMKRLQAVQDMSYLGAGFRIALKDLEIRGAGNILGAEQSGHIFRVGFDIYMEMLEGAVAELKGETLRTSLNPEIRIGLSAYIPEQYISDVTMRISVYRRLSECPTLEALKDMEDELNDRFGALPAETENLLSVLRLKILAKGLFINRIIEDAESYRFYFQAAELDAYGIPEGYHQSIFDVLGRLQRGIKRFRFIDGGFSMAKPVGGSKETFKSIEDILNKIVKALTV